MMNKEILKSVSKNENIQMALTTMLVIFAFLCFYVAISIISMTQY